MQTLGFNKLFSLLSLLALVAINSKLMAVLIDCPLGRDSAMACQSRSQGDICGHAEPKARFAGLASVPVADEQALTCDQGCCHKLFSGERATIQKHKLSFYNAYHSIARP